MQILILGSEGFIGQHLVNFFLRKDYKVYGADLLERNSQVYIYHKVSRLSPEQDDLLQHNKFDACINAAGSGNVSYSMTHPVIDFEANSLDTMRILDAIRRYQPECRYIHISSAAVYGNPQKNPVSECDSLKPLSPYGWHKLIAEQICREFTQLYGVYTAIVRPFSVYGPGLKKQLFWDLYQKVMHAGPGASVELFGTGKESRDFIYIDDLVFALDCILQKSMFEADVYNVGVGKETTIENAATLFVSLFEKTMQVAFNQKERSGDPINWKADISKLSDLGYYSRVPLEEGLTQTVQWLRGL